MHCSIVYRRLGQFGRFNIGFDWSEWEQTELVANYGFSPRHPAIWIAADETLAENIAIYLVDTERFLLGRSDIARSVDSITFTLNNDELIDNLIFHLIDIDNQRFQVVALSTVID